MKKSEEILDELNEVSEKVSKKTLNGLLSEEKKIKEKERKLDKKKFFTLGRQLKTALSLLKDYKSGNYRDITWKSIAIIVTAVLYFLNPFDAIPDIFTPLGFTDDAVVLGFVFTSLKQELKRYSEWKNADLEEELFNE